MFCFELVVMLLQIKKVQLCLLPFNVQSTFEADFRFSFKGSLVGFSEVNEGNLGWVQLHAVENTTGTRSHTSGNKENLWTTGELINNQRVELGFKNTLD